MVTAAPRPDKFTLELQPMEATTLLCTPGISPYDIKFSAFIPAHVSRYMPKDEPSDGLGHRHDWEGTIVWLTSSTSTTADNIVAVCPSAHGGWDCSTSGYTLSGTKPLIKYQSVWPVDHACGLTTTVGGTEPLIAWESLPTVAQTALDTTDFGSAIVPFIDAHFTTNLGKATF